NAWFKDGNVPKAILNYERALKLNPSYDDARFNLEFARTQIQDRIEEVPEFVLAAWGRKMCYKLSSNVWAVLFIVFLAGALAMLLMFLLSSGRGARRAGFFSAIGLFLVALLCLDFAYWQYSDYRKTDSAIVMVPVSSVKSSPSSGVDAKDLFVLHEGTKVRILDEAGDWMNIELADGRQGWMRKSEVEMP
ncbi:MAG: tetratricopeptide repeat protein, partial [Bacteroidales bacterium]|nr:tetratricopeptide repeat protein [Bacteroidales bacterium]